MQRFTWVVCIENKADLHAMSGKGTAVGEGMSR